MSDVLHWKKTKGELIAALENAHREIGRLGTVQQPKSDTYSCQRCGRRDRMDAVVDDKIWKKISPNGDHGGILCLWCMDALCLEKGIGGEVKLYFPGDALVSVPYKEEED
jgi:hypothetical protein